MSVVSIEKFEILPQNQPSGGKYSFKSGTPLIQFSIGSQAKYLRSATLRLNGKFSVKKGDGTRPNNQSLKATGTGAVEINSRVGIHSCFQNVNISSNDTQSSLESIRSYGRMSATILPSTHDSQDFMCQAGVVSGNTGLSTSSSVMLNNERSFSLPIYSGLLMGTGRIPLSLIKGLMISFELASDNAVLFGADAPSGTGAFYELSDLSITGDMEIMDIEGQSKLQIQGSGSMEYNSFTNLYSVLDSADSTQTYNISNSNVLSVFQNYLPVTHGNSYLHDGMKTDVLKNTDGTGQYVDDVVTKRLGFSRGGIKIGTDYDIVTETQSTEGRPETGLMVHALDSVKKIGQITSTLSQPQLLSFSGGDDIIYRDSGKQKGVVVDEGERNFAVGLAMDRFSGVGVNFKDVAFSTRLQTTLDGKSPNSAYTYVLSKNLLTYTPSSVSVVS